MNRQHLVIHFAVFHITSSHKKYVTDFVFGYGTVELKSNETREVTVAHLECNWLAIWLMCIYCY